MQYKNPTDIELVNAADEAYNAIIHILEYLNISPNSAMPLRLKNAINTARHEMRLQEEADRTDFVSTTAPPGSMD